MTDSDGEQRLADALRAKASQSGGEQTTPVTPSEQTDVLPRVAGPPMRQPDPGPAEPALSGPLTSGWIMLLAVLLGLATGAVIGLLTVL